MHWSGTPDLVQSLGSAQVLDRLGRRTLPLPILFKAPFSAPEIGSALSAVSIDRLKKGGVWAELAHVHAAWLLPVQRRAPNDFGGGGGNRVPQAKSFFPVFCYRGGARLFSRVGRVRSGSVHATVRVLTPQTALYGRPAMITATRAGSSDRSMPLSGINQLTARP